MAVPEHHNSKSGGFRFQIELGENVKHVNGNAFDLYRFAYREPEAHEP